MRSYLADVVHDVDLLQNTPNNNSPQYLAFRWLIDEDPLYLCPLDPQAQVRFILATLYFALEGQNWDQCSQPENVDNEQEANASCTIQVNTVENNFVSGSNAWLTGEHECTWGGVACNTEQNVTVIEFEDNNIQGGIPPEVCQLTSLTVLTLEDGGVTGPLPECIGNLAQLQVLDLNDNFITGTLPESLYDLTNLVTLDLDQNNFRGSLSSKIGQLVELEFLQLLDNRLTGVIPSELGLLSSLETIQLEVNLFEGRMPDSVCALRDLNIRVLTSDCEFFTGRGSPPFVDCSFPDCCTDCF